MQRGLLTAECPQDLGLRPMVGLTWLKGEIGRSPYSVQYAGRWFYAKVRPVPGRYGSLFKRYYQFLNQSQWWDEGRLREYQLGELKKLLRHAYENVPYYRERFQEACLTPEDIQGFEELKRLPYLTKEIIRTRFADLVARNVPPSDMEWSSTGGSTGTPLRFFIQRSMTQPIDWAFLWRAWNWGGYRFGDRCAVLRECTVRRVERGKRSWWEFDPGNNYLILSTYHMSQATLPGYVRKLREFKPKIIQAFPSAIWILVRFMQLNGSTGPPMLKTVMCTSESIYPFQRDLIRKVLGCEVRSFYGQGEDVVLAAECEHGSLHLCPEFGVTEIIGKDGREVTEEGEVGELVGTGFHNYAMPFVRYRTGDLASLSRENCECGRGLPVLKSLEGRLQEFIVARDGRLIPLRSLFCSAHLGEADRVRKAQLLQREPGKLLVKLAVTPEFREKDALGICRRLEWEADGGVDCEAVLVDDIEGTEAGKFNYIIQELPVEKMFLGANDDSR